ncbi:transposase [Prolixibacter bellariivorans]|uniref:transposase n=1 Tax=Prolixibacter bellariivorans TaxID=314319 RepID=UPI00046F777B|nr:transposase [Prolixibacter bellariivorans]
MYKALFGRPWVVYCKQPFFGPAQVVEYLGQYTHRVAITNQRILNIADGKVTFVAKDYRDRAIKKPVTLNGVEFLRRFTMHILPKRFVKIRRFGIYNHTVTRNLNLQFTPEEKPDIDKIISQQKPPETNVERFERLTGVNLVFARRAKPGEWLP